MEHSELVHHMMTPGKVEEIHDPTAPPQYDTDIFQDEQDQDIPVIPIHTIVDVTRRISVIKRIERKIDVMKEHKRTFNDFFTNRITKLEATITEIKGQIRVFMDINGTTNIATPQGTAYEKNIEETEWEDERVWEWLQTLDPTRRAEFVRMKEELDKNAIKAYARMHDVPGLTFTRKGKVYVR